MTMTMDPARRLQRQRPNQHLAVTDDGVELCLRGSPVPGGSRPNSTLGRRSNISRPNSRLSQRSVGVSPGPPPSLSERVDSDVETPADDDYETEVATRSEPGTSLHKDYLSLEEYQSPLKRSVTSFSAPAQYAASRGFCVRSRSALLRETDGLVNSLSRQCCDVLGPKICHECAIIKRRNRDARRYESFLPRVEITGENLTTTLLISRAFPDLPLEQIQSKINAGDILKPTFKHNLQKMHERRQKEHAKGVVISAFAKKKAEKAAAQKPTVTYSFFKSIKDLNRKLVQGQMARKIILTGDAKKDLAWRRRPVDSTEVKPASGSAQAKEGEGKEKRPSAFFEPPLLPKVCQNVEPAFFAGQDAAYKLPGKQSGGVA